MKTAIDLSAVHLPRDLKEKLATTLEELRRLWGDAIRSISLYGSGARGDYREGVSDLNMVIELEDIDLARMKPALNALALARRNRIMTLLIAPKEIEAGATLFGSKYLSIKETHLTLFGEDPFVDLEIDASHLLFRLRQDAHDLIFRLRRHYVTSDGGELTNMLNKNGRNLFRLLRMTLALDGVTVKTWEDINQEAAQRYHLDREVMAHIVALRSRVTSLPKDEAEALYDGTLNLLGRLAEILDRFGGSATDRR